MQLILRHNLFAEHRRRRGPSSRGDRGRATLLASLAPAFGAGRRRFVPPSTGPSALSVAGLERSLRARAREVRPPTLRPLAVAPPPRAAAAAPRWPRAHGGGHSPASVALFTRPTGSGDTGADSARPQRAGPRLARTLRTGTLSGGRSALWRAVTLPHRQPARLSRRAGLQRRRLALGTPRSVAGVERRCAGRKFAPRGQPEPFSHPGSSAGAQFGLP